MEYPSAVNTDIVVLCSTVIYGALLHKKKIVHRADFSVGAGMLAVQ